MATGPARPAPPPSRPALTWSRTFPATADQVPQARRFLAALLGGAPPADDALICLSELVTNAICHSRSGLPGGHFTIHAALTAAILRIEVEDQGGPWAPRPAGAEHGQGLTIVRALAHYAHVSDIGRDAPSRTATFCLRLA